MIFGAYEAQLDWIFANLFNIHEFTGYLGPMKNESPGYLGHMKCYSPDIRESPGYSGPMKHKSHVHFQISRGLGHIGCKSQGY